MHVSEIADIVKNVELYQLTTEDQSERVVAYLNFALGVVYSRVDILQKTIDILIQPNQTIYQLPEELIRIINIYPFGKPYEEIPLNDETLADSSLFTRSTDILLIPSNFKEENITILYSASPPSITVDNLDSINLNVPTAFVEPIVDYIGYRGFKAHNPDDKTEVGAFLRFFNTSLRAAIATNSIHSRWSTSKLLDERGFN